MFKARHNKLIQSIRQLLLKAVSFGVGNSASPIVEEYIAYHEFGLAFEHIVYALNENDISIDNEYFNEIKKVADLMQIGEGEYRPRLEKLILK